MADASCLEARGPLESRPRVNSASKVHFNETQVTPDHSGFIQVTVSPDATLADVHVGFLQIGRKYEITFKVPIKLTSDSLTAKPHHDIQLISHKPISEHSHQVTLHMTTTHEKHLIETFVLECDDGTFLTLKIEARVLGHGKGTPMLKTGIHCIAIEHPDSDVSDTGYDGVDAGFKHRSNLDCLVEDKLI